MKQLIQEIDLNEFMITQEEEQNQIFQIDKLNQQSKQINTAYDQIKIN